MKGLPDELLRLLRLERGARGQRAEAGVGWGVLGWEQFSSGVTCIDLHGVRFFRYVFQADPDLGQVVQTSCAV